MILQIANNPLPNYTSVFVYPLPHPEHFAMAFLVFADGTCIECGFRASHDRTLAATLAAIAGVLSLGPHPGLNTTIFLPNCNLHRPLFSLTKHKYLPQASMFTAALDMQCFLHPHTFISILPLPVKLNRKPTRADPRVFPCNWPGLRGKDFNLAELRAKSQLYHLPENHPSPPLKTLPFRLWKVDQDDCADPPKCRWTGGTIPVPDSSVPSDLVLGALSLGQRHALSAVLQVFFQHCFCGAYSQRMRPNSGDTIICPCTYSTTPIPMTELDHDGNPGPKAWVSRDRLRGRSSAVQPYATPRSIISITPRGEGFEALMAEQHANPHSTPSHSPSPAQGSARLLAARYSGPRRVSRHAAHPRPAVVLHSAPHILSDCPLVSIFCDRLLMGHSFYSLFWTVKGAEALATFLIHSNSLLRPLPARPDPP